MTDVCRVSPSALRQFVLGCLLAAGADPAEAAVVADIMTWSDQIGRETQGVERLPLVIERLRAGVIRSPSTPAFMRRAETIFHLNGRHGFGRYLGQVAMTKAVETAMVYGTGLVVVANSNHFGANAYYAHQAAQTGCLGLVTSNAYPRVAPHGAVSPVFGTNPLAFAAPTRQGEAVLIDMSTSVYAGSHVRMAKTRGETLTAPGLINPEGEVVSDPAHEVYSALLPAGGPKGTSLALLVEILSSVISGAAMSTQIGSVFDNGRTQNLGQAFLAIHVPSLMPLSTFYDRLDWLLTLLQAADPVPGGSPLRYPGQRRWQLFHEQATGIRLIPEVVTKLRDLAYSLNLPPVC